MSWRSEEGRSIRSVAREMGIGRNTIRKYLTLSESVRAVRQRKPSPVKEMEAPRIDEIIEEWRGRTTAKQRITGTRIHRQLKEKSKPRLSSVASYCKRYCNASSKTRAAP